MTLLHNQINRLWHNPSYLKFKEHGFARRIFTSKDTEGFLRTGAYLIKEAEKRSDTIIPWDEKRRYEILANPRLENAFLALGTEYLLKGIFLSKGYAINKHESSAPPVSYPILLKGNRDKLRSNEVQDLSQIIAHLGRVIDFSEFDKSQKDEEKKAVAELKGIHSKGIEKLTIPFPNAKQILEYLHFKRNYALHRPFIIPEFRGITRHVFKLLDYIAQKGTGRKIEELSKLNDTSGEK